MDEEIQQTKESVLLADVEKNLASLSAIAATSAGGKPVEFWEKRFETVEGKLDTILEFLGKFQKEKE
jgi:hypothetical protein